MTEEATHPGELYLEEDDLPHVPGGPGGLRPQQRGHVGQDCLGEGGGSLLQTDRYVLPF